jgi:4-hydroxybenzoate polyprenyltransferase
MRTWQSRFEELKPILILAYLSFLGCFSVFAVQVYLGLGFQPLICVCSMGIIFGIYTSNRFTDAAEDFTNDLQRALFFQQRRIYYALAIAALAGSLGILMAERKLNWLHFLLLAMGFCYSYRLIPWYRPGSGLIFLRIKEMTLIKNLAVSFLWGGSVFLVPILYAAAQIRNPFLLAHLGAGMVLSTLNNTLFDDVLDADGDRLAGIKTLPALWGVRNSVVLLWALDAAWIAWCVACRAAGRLDTGHAAFLVFLGLYPAAYMGLSRFGRAPKPWIDFLMESDLLLFSLGLLLLGAQGTGA